MTGTIFAGRIRALPAVESTNDALRALATAGAPEGTVVLAGRQTAGRGRRGRTWHSAPGLGLYLSVLFRLRRDTQPVTRWTLTAAVAACQACRDVCGEPVEIKWPNDLLHEGRKLGGILAELRTPGNQDAELVIGTGINVGHRAQDFPPELAGTATSLDRLSCSSMHRRESLAAAYLRRLDGAVTCLREGGWDAIALEFERLSPGCRGVRVNVRTEEATARPEIRGVTHGLDPSGALIVLGPTGEQTLVRMADAVRPAED